MPFPAFHPPLPLSHVSLTTSLARTSPTQSLQPHTTRCTRPVVRAALSPPNASTDYAPQVYPPSVQPYPKPSGPAEDSADAIRTLPSIPAVFRRLCQNPERASEVALIDEHHGPAVTLTYAQLLEKINLFTAGLRRFGFDAERVAFFSENSHRWFIADQAIMALSGSAAVRGVDAPVQELIYIYNHSCATTLFVETPQVLEKLVAGGIDRTAIKMVVVLYGSVDSVAALLPGVSVYPFNQVLSNGQDPTLEETQPLPTRSDIATLLYTSGTTGNPKGVILTHSNILSQLEDISLGSYDPRPGWVFVSILPCWHVFERTAAYWTLSRGVTLVYSNKLRFREDLQKHKPQILISVPRVFDNLNAAIMKRLSSASASKKALFAFFMAISLAFIKAKRKLNGLTITPKPSLPVRMLAFLQVIALTPLYALANALVWKKIRESLGGRLHICLSGGGLIASYLEDFFEAIGVNICVGYGLTETSPVIANRFSEHNVSGTTGMELPRAFVKILDRYTHKPVQEGEVGTLYVGGPYVFRGYWNDEEATAKAIGSDGYFNTGDLAYRGAAGDIVITGRSKDLIVLSNGENIEPGPIEDAVLASPFVDQVMLVGQDERSLGVLVVPELQALQSEGLIDEGFREKVEAFVEAPEDNRAELGQLELQLYEDKRVRSMLNSEIRDRNSKRENYSSNDRIAKVRILLTPFTVENGMMTQTLKIKKNVVMEKYKEEIENMFRK